MKIQEVLRLSELEDFYETCFKAFGKDDVRTLGWVNSESQFARFNAIKSIGIKSQDHVLDVGCGFGDLYFYLKDSIGDIRYTGIERKKFLADIARTNLSSEKNAEIKEHDIIDFDSFDRSFDWVVASGIFPFAYDGFLDEVYGYVKKMFKMSKSGVSFNLLTSLAPEENKFDHMQYSNPAEIISKFSSISTNFRLLHDYLPNDMTIHLYK